MLRRILPVLAGSLIALSAACGGSAANETATVTPEPTAQATEAPRSQDPVISTRETAAPTPSTSGPARITSTINGSCRLADNGSEITVMYRVVAEGGATLTRVRFLVDGRVSEDTNPTDERDFRRTATIKVADGSIHAFQVIAEGASSRSSAGTSVRCVAPTQGPRL